MLRARKLLWVGCKLATILIASSLALGLLSSCSFAKMAVARAHSRDRFVPTQSNPNVRYDNGSQEMAERVAKAITHSREIVEQTHGTTFTLAPSVFVCHTECFTTFVPVSKEVASAQFADAVFMNDDVLKLREQQRGMPVENFLTHELTHLLLYQRAGLIADLRVPSWFKEGIAVAVSNGAGVGTRNKPGGICHMARSSESRFSRNHGNHSRKKLAN